MPSPRWKIRSGRSPKMVAAGLSRPRDRRSKGIFKLRLSITPASCVRWKRLRSWPPIYHGLLTLPLCPVCCPRMIHQSFKVSSPPLAIPYCWSVTCLSWDGSRACWLRATRTGLSLSLLQLRWFAVSGPRCGGKSAGRLRLYDREMELTAAGGCSRKRRAKVEGKG